ncbi:potassium channel protein [Pseudoalteromonas denitrificans]|uniref:Voltage-gated potassium channel n=1 Tax=Pseudoalteromonas denitrificans DSM 6059 TaxID=1123010 RepID=A0A1I1MD34_9GAMM|nr:potassium channel family protein [Pseudoalteromonas denitrificans]SFC83321.1 voltage-gated potassium channel [Pseudoalteromonas denitrificans DSM 6059]
MHLLFKKFLSKVRNHIDQLSWPIVLFAMLAHIIMTWVLLWLANEKDLILFSHFFYYYIVTTSTVGYGDFSPVTDLGKWFVAIAQIPMGLALFGVFLGKTGQTITQLIKRAMTGEKNYSHHDGHIIIFGWHKTRTAKMIQYILADNKREQRQILLVVMDEITHPFIDNPQVDFAKLTSFTDREQLERVAIDKADKVIIDGKDDDQTFTTALRISKLVKSSSHICAYFIDETKIEMLREHCINIECSSSKSAEILVRSMQDPGSSRVQEVLLSTLTGDTQFSIEVPKSIGILNFEKVFHHFKHQHNAILLGIASNRIGEKLTLNPSLSHAVEAGNVLHYIAADRLLTDEISWLKI